MGYFLGLAREYPVLFIISVSLVATVLIINSAFYFAERIINNRLLLVFSLVVFYFLVRIAITEEVKKKHEKS